MSNGGTGSSGSSKRRRNNFSLSLDESTSSPSLKLSTMIKNRTSMDPGLTSGTGGIVKLRKESSMTPVSLSPEEDEEEDADDLEQDEERDENTKWNKQTSSTSSSATDTGRPVIQSAASRSSDHDHLTSSGTGTRSTTSSSSTTTTTNTNSRIIKLSKKSPSRTDPIIDRYIRFNTNHNVLVNSSNCNDSNSTTATSAPSLRSETSRTVIVNTTPSVPSPAIKSSPSSTIVTPSRHFGSNNNNLSNHLSDETSKRYQNRITNDHESGEDDADSCDGAGGSSRIGHKSNHHGRSSNTNEPGYAGSHSSSRGDNYAVNYDRSPDPSSAHPRSSSHVSYRRSSPTDSKDHYDDRGGGDNGRDYDRDSYYRKETSTSSRKHDYGSSKRYDDGDDYKRSNSRVPTRTYKYYDDDELVRSRTSTSEHRTYEYKSESQYKSSSSRVPSSTSYDYKYESRSHNHRDEDSPVRTISTGPATGKRDTSASKEISSKCVRSFGDWDELLSTTSDKTYYYNRVTKKSQWSKPDEVLEVESRSSAKYHDKYDDRYREEDKYRDKYPDKYREDDRYDKYRDDERRSRTDDRYKDGDRYKDTERYKDSTRYRDDDRYKEDERRSDRYREEERKDYYHKDKYRDDRDRYEELERSGGRRKNDYNDVDRSRKTERFASPVRAESRKFNYDYSPPSNDYSRKEKLNNDSSQSSYRSRRDHSRSRSNHRDHYDRRTDDYDRNDKKIVETKSTRNHSVQNKPSNNHHHGSVAGSSSISPPSDTDSKSDDHVHDSRPNGSKDRVKHSDKEEVNSQDSRKNSPLKISRDDRRIRAESHHRKEVAMDTSEREDNDKAVKRKRSQTPSFEEDRLKRTRTASDGTESSKSMTPVSKKSSPPENPKSFNNISLSPSQVSLSNLREIIGHFSDAPEMSELRKMNEDDALKTIHQMLRLIKKSSGGHLQQQLVRSDSLKSSSNSPVVKTANLDSVHRSNSKLSALSSRPRAGTERGRSIYDNLKKQSNDIKDDLNRLLPSSRVAVAPSPNSESSDSYCPSPRSDLITRPSRGLLSTPAVNASKSNALAASHSLSSQVLPSITPSLVACFKEDLITHVQGWPADSSERQAKKYADEAHNLGSLNCTRVSAELKMARSLVRLTEIQATLQEQRILFVRQQIKDVEEWKGNQSNATVISPATISGMSSSTSSHHHPLSSNPVTIKL